MVWSTSQAAVGRCNQTAQLLANSVNGERRPRALHPDVVNACPISIESVSVEIIDRRRPTVPEHRTRRGCDGGLNLTELENTPTWPIRIRWNSVPRGSGSTDKSEPWLPLSSNLSATTRFTGGARSRPSRTQESILSPSLSAGTSTSSSADGSISPVKRTPPGTSRVSLISVQS